MPPNRIDSGFGRTGVLILLLLSLAAPSHAASISTTFNVTATVLASCSVTASDLAFGDYAPGAGSDTTINTTVDVTCTNGTNYTIALDGGSVAHDVTARAMGDGGSNTLSYGLYTDASFATVWGDGTASTTTQSGTGNGSAQAAIVYGRIPAGQYVPATSYLDQITVKVTY
jgi:spore coat protein U-like protein